MPVSSYDYTADEARAIILEKLRLGWSVRKSMDFVGKSEKTYEYYMTKADFKNEVAKIRRLQNGQADVEVPDFETFCGRYFGTRLFNHQQQWLDLLNEEPPRNLHPAQVYEPRDPNMILINTPPFHAKTMTLSINYLTWRIIQDPNVRILIISATLSQAAKILSAIKDRLASNTRMFEELKEDFAPAEGYDGNGAMWRQNMIYVNPSLRTRGEKDPTVQALGIGQHIYGARADIIMLDDTVDNENAHEFEKHINWIQTIIDSRLEPDTGKLLMVGTRIKAQDLYSEIRKPVWYSSGESPWTYLTQPAVLESAEDPDNWVTLWPRTNVHPPGRVTVEPDDQGLYPMWNGPRLARIRNKTSPENWARVYMQAQISATATFDIGAIDGCTNALRTAGVMVAGLRGHRPEGMAGLYVVAGLDPAAVNYTSAVVLGVDSASGKRYLLDVYNKHGALPREVNTMMKAWTTTYGIAEWRIETNAYQASIVQDDDLQQWMRARSVRLESHITGKNKWDPQWGVATMANLFRGHEVGGNMIELPSRVNHNGMQSMVEQLVAWYPTPSLARAPVQDCVMAFWFAEIRARELVDESTEDDFVDSPFTSERDREERVIMDLDWLSARQHYQRPTITGWASGG